MGGASTMTSEERRGIKFRHLQEENHNSSSSLLIPHLQWSRLQSQQSLIHQLLTMSPHSSLLLFVTFWASIQGGLGLPVVKQLEVEGNEGMKAHPMRAKRCACSNLLDSECHYFCHLDIIWVNTPSKTTVYGLGGGLLRRKRSTDRCSCANLSDQPCNSFCHRRSEIKLVQRPQLDIIGILRAAADRSKGARDARLSNREETSEAERKKV
ncbi:unnamed protein product [Menidia menidia]|uniref:(Atlantic silverside) hypothetical protein n=1 Tax=Menidia menidia TaxID=238744 RepID=A0A8S4BNZ4_9TELE|nr:unnamed protein product [Menidia menidia]